jgi:DNA gyrase subunit A
MAEQLNLLAQGQVIPTALHTEMERSYLEYAMSVIVGRALPDVRDGLKPVHRRILYAMYELGLSPDRPFRKCARVVGDVLGKYHPHGDQAVYDAMVRLVQDFSSRYPLLAGHGNFGSVDNDPPAAMRYTETRLAQLSFDALLEEVNESTVDFTNNFDNSQQEPVVLPAKLPILLLNGCSGIAVGMATNIPPHNLGEIVDGLIALIDKPELSEKKLMELIPGPDFPTGGEIIDLEGIKEAYLTGKGIVQVRGVATIEKILTGKKRSREKTAIIVNELPFQVNKAGWIEKVASLVNQGKITDIADIRDESDREGIRVVIELKRDTEARNVLSQLYKQTALQSNFGVIMLSLVENKPCQLPLKDLLQEFLKFREETLTRQFNYELVEKQERLHLVRGLLIALEKIKKVIQILSDSPDGTTAKQSLQDQLKISEIQANSILAMPLRRITGLEQEKLAQEGNELKSRIAELENLLADRKELLKALKKELRSLKRQFGDRRRTKIIQAVTVVAEENVTQTKTQEKTSQSKNVENNGQLPLLISAPEMPENAIVQITTEDKIYWRHRQNISETPVIKSNTDLVAYQQITNPQDQEITVFFNSGKAYPLAIDKIPAYPTKETIGSLVSNSATQNSAHSINYLSLNKNNSPSSLVLLTLGGYLKRIKIKELNGLGNRGFQLIKLKNKDSLGFVVPVNEDGEIAIATNGGRILRYQVTEEQIPTMGKSAQGNIGIKLRYGESIIGCEAVDSQSILLLVSQLGYARLLPIKNIRKIRMGEIGNQAFRFKDQEDKLAQILSVNSTEQVILQTTSNHRHVVDLNKLSLTNNNEKQIVKLSKEERIAIAVNWWGNFPSSANKS